jgi:pimeloyl-ACP methyl ester carboxylesterase
MHRRLAFFFAFLPPLACTIFNGITPTASDGGADGARSDGGASEASCSEGGACVQGQGLCAPQPTCSSSAPCQHGVIYTPDGGGLDQEITTALNVPTCVSTSPAAQDTVMTWADKSGATRAACVYNPHGSTALPLVVFFHPLGGSADDVYNFTNLRAAATITSLGDGPGFALASDQGENLQSVDGYHAPGPEHDIYYRDLLTNPDFEAADYLIDTLVGTTLRGIDTSRIFVMGWGEGAFFAEEYAIIRNVTPTSGGNRVAAAAVYDGADPFQSPRASETGCTLTPYPKSSVAIDLVHRACSVVPCNAAQASQFGAPPGYDVEDWVSTLTMLGIHRQDHIIDIGGQSALGGCTAAGLCTQTLAAANAAWPKNNESDMLGFLAGYRLP